jgi:hypothetical protein
MEIDEQKFPGYEQPPRSGRNWFACCGIGCLLLFLVCGAGAAIFYFMAGDYFKMFFEFVKLHSETVANSVELEVVQQKLGKPVKIVRQSTPNIEQKGEFSILLKSRTDLEGSTASGVLNADYLLEPGKPVHRTTYNLEVDGEVFDLTNEQNGLELDIEEGDFETDSDDTPDSTKGDLDDENDAQPELSGAAKEGG